MKRRCPFGNCTRRIPSRLFACAYHWFTLTKADQAAIYAAYEDFRNGVIDGNQLRDRQQGILKERGDVWRAEEDG